MERLWMITALAVTQPASLSGSVRGRRGSTAVDEMIDWTSDIAPIEILEAIRTHTFSDSWNVPDDVMDRVQRRLVGWACERYGDLERPLPSTLGFAVSIRIL